jgi:uncharacterized protein YndB with AHSA1/START domain
MKQDNVCTVSLKINAPKSRVWDALINPEKIAKYFFGTKATSDWKVGSSLTFSGDWEGKPYEDKGTILQMEKERIFKYDYWSNFSGQPDAPENYQTITYTLTEDGANTIFTVTQENCKTEEAREHSEKNWNMLLGSMKEMLDKGEI